MAPSTSQQVSASPQTSSIASPNQTVKNSGMYTFPSNPTNDTAPSNIAPLGDMQQQQVPTLRSATAVDSDGISRVLTKRKIQELVAQIDPSERLEPEVEDVKLK